MKDKIFSIFKLVIILGVSAIAFNVLFGENTMIFIEKDLIEGTTILWYKINLQGYIEQLQTAITWTPELQLAIPTKHWIAIGGVDWFNDLAHNLSILVDYVILVVNVILYPLKVGGYLERFILALLGLNYNDPESSIYWLGNMSRTLIELTIPYI